MRLNEHRPAMIFFKVGALLLICAAAWLTIRFIIATDDHESGVQDSLPDPDPKKSPLFPR